jgi:ribonuclease BN (tRNA processing enzyme)
VRITLLPSAAGPRADLRLERLTSFLVNDTVAIDAGSLAFALPPEDLLRINHLFLSHTHLDHLASLPAFLDIAHTPGPDCPTLHGSDEVLECLRRDLFNDRLWPDFINMPPGRSPFLRLEALPAGRPVEVEGLRITAVPVHHAVPTVGFLVDDGKAAVVISSDTGPTDEIWKWAAAVPHLRAAFVEATFPERMAWLAEVSGHLTPSLLAREVKKLNRDVPLFAYHLHARYRDEVAGELAALGLPRLTVAPSGQVLEF